MRVALACLGVGLAALLGAPVLPALVLALVLGRVVLGRERDAEEPQPPPADRIEVVVEVAAGAADAEEVGSPAAAVRPADAEQAKERLSGSEERILARATPKEREAMRALLGRLSADATFRPDHPGLLGLGTINAWRFLNARNWNAADAESLWRRAVAWRTAFRVSEKRARLGELRALGPGHDVAFDFLSRHWFTFHVGPDVNGVPVCVMRASTSDPYGLVRELNHYGSTIAANPNNSSNNEEDTINMPLGMNMLITSYVDLVERTMEQAIAKDVFDLGIVDITDLRESHVPHYFSRAYNAVNSFRALAKIMDEVYPERIRRIVLFGVPRVFNAVWKIAQNLVPAETRKKVLMFSTWEEAKWVECLQRDIPRERLPAFMGGPAPDLGVLEGNYVPKGAFDVFAKHDFPQTFVRVGIIADVQYCDKDDGYNFNKTRIRRYRGSLEVGLRQAVEEFRNKNVECVIQLGDLVDGFCKTSASGAPQAVERVNLEFDRLNATAAGTGEGGGNATKQTVAVHHVVGNHELMNFSRQELARLLRGNKHPIQPRAFSPNSLNSRYRFIILDTYEIGILGVDESSEAYKAAERILLANHPRDWRTDTNWLSGIRGLNRRFVPYNGGVSPAQIEFLQTECARAVEENQLVLVFSHIPVQPGSCSSSCLVWNYRDILDVLNTYPTAKFGGERGVLAVFAGHDHAGGYFLSEAGIHHVTLPSPLESLGNLAHGVLTLGMKGVYLHGTGAVQSRSLRAFRAPDEARNAFATFAAKEIDALFAASASSSSSSARSRRECEDIWHQCEGVWEAFPPGWPRRAD